MQNEFTYFAIFMLVAAIALLALWRMFRAANSTIRQLSHEARRDRLHRERIAREKRYQSRALRRGTRRINGKSYATGWDQQDRRARRDYHVDESADEVFDPVSDVHGMDVPTPWGWPASGGRGSTRSYRSPRSSGSSLGNALTRFFRPKEVVTEEVLNRRKQSIRALVEDRYGRVGYQPQPEDIEWTRSNGPERDIEVHEMDQVTSWKLPGENEEKPRIFKGLRLVSDNTHPNLDQRRASGE